MLRFSPPQLSASPQLDITRTINTAVCYMMLFLTLILSACSDNGAGGNSVAPTPPPDTSEGEHLFQYFVVGDPDTVVSIPGTPSSASYVLMGGGPDVDPAFRWMIQRAGIRPGTGGRFVIIRASGTEAYNPYLFYSDATLSTSNKIDDEWVGGAALGLSSVETLVIPDRRAANDPKVSVILARANAVFIAGGDQSDYVKYWKGTKLDSTLNSLMKKNVPLGGTSAGLAVLGQFSYSSLYDTITSSEAMLNPYDRNITFDPNPLSLNGGFITPPELAYMIFDSHFDSRNRMGRFITFISRIVAPEGGFGCPGGILKASTGSTTSARGIGLSVETALLVQGNGPHQPVTAMRVTNESTTSESAVYFLRPSVAPSFCAAQQPLTIRSVEIKKLADSNTVFNLSEWTGVPVYEFLDVDNGLLIPESWN